MTIPINLSSRSRWPHSLRCRSAAARIVGSSPTGGIDFCHECCVLSGTGPYNGPITPPDESRNLKDEETRPTRALKPWKTR